MNHVQVLVKSKKMDSIPMEVQEDLMLDTNKNLENVGLIVFLNNDYSLVMIYDKFHYSTLNIINEMIMVCICIWITIWLIGANMMCSYWSLTS
ncbi:hypothetical protein ERO13_D10G055701v2 [Gossypium hirsutum]|nr:hypothetical protein ERO13_D10G055701v2 [Gossypium hirsutum]